MIDYILTLIMVINISLGGLYFILRIMEKTHSCIQPSSISLFSFRLFVMVCLMGSVICGPVIINGFLSFLMMIPRELTTIVLLVIVGIGMIKYASQLFQLQSLINRASYCRKINTICLLFTSNVSACSFSLMRKSYIVLPVALLEDHDSYIVTLRHEMQHCRQRDGLWQHIIAIIGIVSWWNNLYAGVTRYAYHISELYCDQAIMTKYALNAQEYARTLLTAKKIMDAAYDNHSNLTIRQTEKHMIYSRIQQLFKQPMDNIRRLRAWLRMTLISCLVLSTSLLTLNATAHVLIQPSQVVHATHYILDT